MRTFGPGTIADGGLMYVPITIIVIILVIVLLLMLR